VRQRATGPPRSEDTSRLFRSKGCTIEDAAKFAKTRREERKDMNRPSSAGPAPKPSSFDFTQRAAASHGPHKRHSLLANFLKFVFCSIDYSYPYSRGATFDTLSRASGAFGITDRSATA